MKWLGVFAAVIALAVLAYKITFPSYSYHYRLELAVEIDGKPHVGSSVIEVHWGCGPTVGDSGGCAAHLGGQAALIDLGSRGMLIAPLRNGGPYYLTTARGTDAVFLCAQAFGNRSSQQELSALTRLSGRRDLSPTNFPYLVWLPNPADPKSARSLTLDELTGAIDPTARFSEAFVEITSDPIVTDITDKLPWLPALIGEQRGKGIPGQPRQFQLVYNMFVGEDT